MSRRLGQCCSSRWRTQRRIRSPFSSYRFPLTNCANGIWHMAHGRTSHKPSAIRALEEPIDTSLHCADGVRMSDRIETQFFDTGAVRFEVDTAGDQSSE